jgi:hypothetical protein
MASALRGAEACACAPPRPQEARDQCDALEQRLQEGAAALAEAAGALAARASQEAQLQVGRRRGRMVFSGAMSSCLFVALTNPMTAPARRRRHCRAPWRSPSGRRASLASAWAACRARWAGWEGGELVKVVSPRCLEALRQQVPAGLLVDLPAPAPPPGPAPARVRRGAPRGRVGRRRARRRPAAAPGRPERGTRGRRRRAR